MNKKDDKGGFIIGGCTMIGLGVGFFMLPIYGALAFVGSLMSGIGIGLLIASTLIKK